MNINFIILLCLLNYITTVNSADSEEYLEEVHIMPTLTTLNAIRTFDEREVKFLEDDIKILTEECNGREDCLIQKEVSVEKFNRKLQAIQCVHGLLVLKVMDELKAILYDRRNDNIHELKELLRKPISKHKRYLTTMVALVNMTKRAAYPWQIETFTFVMGLAAKDANIDRYKQFFANHHQSRRTNVLQFVSKCVQHKYLMYKGNKSSEDVTISRLVNKVYLQMEWYLTLRLINFYNQCGLYTVENIMIQHLYRRHDFIFDWSMFREIKLDTRKVKRKLVEQIVYRSQQPTHEWELDPIGGNKYNALIAKCIELRLAYLVWYHLHIYHTLISRAMDEDALEFWRVTPLCTVEWGSLVGDLRAILRQFRFNRNIYWSAIGFMTSKCNHISKDEIETREKFTRNHFCQLVEDLELASASDIEQRLMNIKVADDHDSMYDEIKANSKKVTQYFSILMIALLPVDGTFLSLLVSAEGNDTFFLR